MKRLLLLFAYAVIAGSADEAQAVCAKDNLWPSVPAQSGTNISPSTNVNGWVIYAVDTRVYAKTVDGVDRGSLVLDGVVEGQPAVGPLSADVTTPDSHWYIFVTTQRGTLYKLSMGTDAPGAGTLQFHSMVDTRRPSCSSDSLAPGVSANFKQPVPGGTDDLLIVATQTGCGDHTANRILAYRASGALTGRAPVWQGPGEEHEVDDVTGCTLDYQLNRVYCSTNLEDGHWQNTLWALNAATGALVWGNNVNAIHMRPQLPARTPTGQTWRHLYVIDTLGTLHAFDPDAAPSQFLEGSEAWSHPMTLAAVPAVEHNIWAEFRDVGGYSYRNLVFSSDTAGRLHAVRDLQTSAEPLWDQTFASLGANVRSVSLGTVSPTLGKLFVGLNNGDIHQLTLATGDLENAKRTVIGYVPPGMDTGSQGEVRDPTLYRTGSTSEVDRVFAAVWVGTQHRIKMFCAPFAASSAGADVSMCGSDGECDALRSPPTCCYGTNMPAGCNAAIPCCSKGKCELTSQTCFAEPTATVTCNDGEGCTTADRCVSGVCRGTWDTANGGCMGAGQCSKFASSIWKHEPCGGGTNVCKSSAAGGYTCADAANSAGSCGNVQRTCGDNGRSGSQQDWGGNRVCEKGICVRDSKSCTTPSDTILSKAIPNASGIAFDKLENGSTCNAWISQYSTKADAGINKVAHVVPGSGGGMVDFTVPAEPAKGYMAGIIVTPFETDAQDKADPASVITTFLPRQFGGSDDTLNNFGGIWDRARGSVRAILHGQEPAFFGEGDDYELKDFNFGMSPPASDGKEVAGAGGGRVFFGNFDKAGDLFMVKSASDRYTQEKAFLGAEPPWCPAGGCTRRITSLAFSVKAPNTAGADQLLRVGYDAVVSFIHPDGCDSCAPKVAKYEEVARIDLKKAQPFENLSGGGAKQIKSIMSMAVDGLNRTNDTYVEVKEIRSGANIHYILVINGLDHSVRPLFDYVTPGGKTVRGIYWDRHMNPPTLSDEKGEGRITASSVTRLHRLIPVDPTNSKDAVITSYPLPH